MGFFKKKRDTPKIFNLIDQTVSAMSRLKAMGGFGYVLFGSGLIILFATIAWTNVLASIFNWLLSVSTILLGLGIIFVIVERVLAYRMAEMKFRMIIAISEAAATKWLESHKHVDLVHIRELVTNILPKIWSMWLPVEGKENT